MPNHITNYLSVTGSEKEVERFRIQVSSENKELQERRISQDKAQLESLKKSNYPQAYLKQRVKDIEECIKNPPRVVLDFNGTVPMPMELEGTEASFGKLDDPEEAKALMEKYGATDWYQWHLNNWGTKWNAYDVDNEPETIEGGLRYRFDTAWSSPAQWLYQTAEQFPELRFEDAWQDEGGGAGILKVWHDEGTLQEDHQEMSDHEWSMEYNPGYREEYTHITEGPYEEVLKDYAETESITNWGLEPYFVDRIKPEDLPTLVGREWMSYGAQEKFEQRIKEGMPENG
jgi:hypothetical protein